MQWGPWASYFDIRKLKILVHKYVLLSGLAYLFPSYKYLHLIHIIYFIIKKNLNSVTNENTQSFLLVLYFTKTRVYTVSTNIYRIFFFVFSRSDTSNPYSFKGVYNLNIAEMGNLISGAMQWVRYLYTFTRRELHTM